MDELEVSGYADPEGEAPWAMQIVVCLPKGAEPAHSAVCEAAAMAVVGLIDQAADDQGAWQAAVERWERGRIRKLVRRARGAAWERVCELPGVSVTRRGVTVRALVPGPVDAVPDAVAKLQVAGLDLADQPGLVNGAVRVAVCPVPRLSTGKAAAAAGHAAQLAWRAMDQTERSDWHETGFCVAVEAVEPARFAELCEDAQVVVTDAGFTEIDPGTITAVAWW